MKLLDLQVFVLLTAAAASCFGQTLSNSTVRGRYFVRHVQLTTDNSLNQTDLRSILGTMTFDGDGNYSFVGQQVIGTGSPSGYSVSGTYTMQATGALSITNPQSTSLTINARYGTEAVVGSTTNPNPATLFDLFIAIPAPILPSARPAAVIGNQTLTVNYHMADFELVNYNTNQVQVSGMAAQFDGAGNIETFSPLGHIGSYNGGSTITGEQFTGTYNLTGNGTGTIAFSPVGTTVPSGGLLLNGATRNLYVSASGNMILGATPGAHDILIGIQNAATDNISLSGRVWLAGLEIDGGPDIQNYVMSATVDTTDGNVIITQKDHQFPPVASGIPAVTTQTFSNGYAPLTKGFGGGCSCGVGTYGNVVTNGGSFLLLGNDGTVVVVGPGVDGNGNSNGPNNFAILVGVQIPNLSAPSGQSVWINPQGIVNGSTFAPVGDPISPGEFIQIYGSGMAPAGSSTSSASLPFLTQLDGVSVSINGTNAPLFNVQPGVITCIVPYDMSTTEVATIQVNNNGAFSNSITVPTSPFTPGVISQNTLSFGDGAIEHADYSIVNSAHPAAPGEAVQMYVTGLGALTTPVSDGSGFIGVDSAVVQPIVLVNGTAAQVFYGGLTPDAGLYLVDFYVPPNTPSGEQSVTLASSNGTVAEINSTVTIAIQ